MSWSQLNASAPGNLAPDFFCSVSACKTWGEEAGVKKRFSKQRCSDGRKQCFQAQYLEKHPTCAHFLLRLVMWIAAMCWKSWSAGMRSGRRVRNWAMWMKSMLVRTSWYRRSNPRAVRNRNSSPSLQNTSHTRHARSNGSDLLYRVKILKGQTDVKEKLLSASTYSKNKTI